MHDRGKNREETEAVDNLHQESQHNIGDDDASVDSRVPIILPVPTRLRVSALPFILSLNAELAEPADQNILTRGKTLFDQLNESFNDLGGSDFLVTIRCGASFN